MATRIGLYIMCCGAVSLLSEAEKPVKQPDGSWKGQKSRQVMECSLPPEGSISTTKVTGYVRHVNSGETSGVRVVGELYDADPGVATANGSAPTIPAPAASKAAGKAGANA